MRRTKLVVAAGLIAAVSAVGLTTAGVGNAKSTKSTAGSKIFLIPKFIGIPVFTQNSVGAKAAAKELGDTVTYNGPTSASATAQVPFINTAVQQGAGAIIISGDDPNAVAPALKRAMAKGIKVISYDADVAPDARDLFVSPPDAKSIGAAQVEWLGSAIGYKGDFAILSASPTEANQNTWIKFMKVRSSCRSTRACTSSRSPTATTTTRSRRGDAGADPGLPEPQGHHLAHDGRRRSGSTCAEQQKKCSIALTGLGIPSQMRPYIKSGCVKKVGLWNETDFGYLAAYAAHEVIAGKITGKTGESFKAGHLGVRKVLADKTIILSKPIVFTKANIDQYHF